MKRIIFWSSISLLVIPLTLFQSPQVKFKLLEIFADRVKLSQDFMSNDSLNLVLCGSRSPLAAPGRAETCFIVKAVAELSDTATFISVPSGLIESTAMSPTFVILLSPKLTLSPKVLFVSVAVDAVDTSRASPPVLGNVSVLLALSE